MVDIFDTFTPENIISSAPTTVPEVRTGGLDTPLSAVLPEEIADLFATEIGVHTTGDFLTYYPRKHRASGDWANPYDHFDGTTIRTALTVTKKSLRAFNSGNMARFRRKYLAITGVTDSGHELDTMFFDGQTANKTVHKGNRILVSGVLESRGSRRSLKLNDYETNLNLINRPVRADYPATKNLDKLIIEEYAPVILEAIPVLPEHLPADIVTERRFLSYNNAARYIHIPPTMEMLAAAKTRLAYDEAFATQLVLVSRKTGANQKLARAYPPVVGGLRDAHDAALPFDLTEGQAKVGASLERSLSGNSPANDLLLGDVGLGKTLVGLRAMLQVVDCGGQAVMVAPTEVLAEQHYAGLSKDLTGLDVNLALYTGSLETSARSRIEAQIAAGEVDIVVGTHALLGERLKFAQLGLVVVDEQHRFGVAQRDALRSRTEITPHLLAMTATPIPRTIAMTTYGDLDVHQLTGAPLGRKPITSVVAPLDKPAWIGRIWERMGEEIGKGRQVFIVASLIEHPNTTPPVELAFTGYKPGSTVGLKLTNSAGEQVEFTDAKNKLKKGGRTKANAAGVAMFTLSTNTLEVGTYTAHATAKGQAEQTQPVVARVNLSAGEENQHETEGESEGQVPRPPALTVGEIASLVNQNVPGARVGIMHGRLDAEAKAQVMEAFSARELDVLVSTTVIEVGVNVPNATVMCIWDADRFGAAQLHQLRGRVGRGSYEGLCLLVTSAPAEHPSRERLEGVAATTDGYKIAQMDLEQRREGDVLGSNQAGRSRMKHLTLTEAEPVIRAAREDAQILLGADPVMRAHPGVKKWLLSVLGESEREAITRG